MSDESPTETAAPDGGSTDVVAAEEVERDERREQLLTQVTEALGDAVVGSHIEPGHDLVVRVAADSWSYTAEVVRQRLRARYFCFLSAIDWMPSPFGRSMDSEVDIVLVNGAGVVKGCNKPASSTSSNRLSWTDPRAAGHG